MDRTFTIRNTIFACGMIGITGIASAAIVTGNQVSFSSDDLTSGTARKTITVNKGSTSTNNVWEFSRMSESSNGLAITDAGFPSASVTWKMNVPEDRIITGFTWAWATLILNGSGDDTISWEWSIDNVNWSQLDTFTNNGLRTISNKVYDQTLPTESKTSILYIRVSAKEGTTITGESNYFAVNGGWGTDTNTYIQVTTAPVPEASSLGMLSCFTSALLLIKRKPQ